MDSFSFLEAAIIYPDLNSMGYWLALVSLLKSLVKLIWLIATLKLNPIANQ